jgi:hypothetical protein
VSSIVQHKGAGKSVKGALTATANANCCAARVECCHDPYRFGTGNCRSVPGTTAVRSGTADRNRRQDSHARARLGVTPKGVGVASDRLVAPALPAWERPEFAKQCSFAFRVDASFTNDATEPTMMGA